MEMDQRAETKERIRLFALIGLIGKERKWKGEYTGIVMKHHTGTDRIDKLNAQELRRFLLAIGSDPDRQIKTDTEPEEVPRRGNRRADQRQMANHQ